ncbi:MAG: GAF domain-containing protein [Deltaproteobacteria bacterium]|nr:GAF domain-containing protein [Deltaproteobacteria bacterium]
MKENIYLEALKNIGSLVEGEMDLIAVMSTISCELYHAFEYFSWVGFYRRIDEKILKVGPYQGTHGCLTIPVEKGVCGKCAREGETQIENDVRGIPHHIACSNDTRSEIVIPIKDGEKNVRAVLDIDSMEINRFDEIDQKYLNKICEYVSERFI